MFARFHAILIMLALVSLPAVSSAQSIAAAALDARAAQPDVAHALIAAKVIDADSGATVYARNADTLMLAASTTKLVTEGMTLATLGPDFRFTTPVYRIGNVDASGTLHGDLILVGSGDPNLSGRVRPDGTLAFANEDHSYDGNPDTQSVDGDPLLVLRELASRVRAAGIRRIAGHVLADAHLFEGGYAEAGSGAIVSPLVVNDNIIDVLITPGTAGAAPQFSVSPQTPYARFTMAAKTTQGGRRSIEFSDTGSSDGTRQVTITGTIPTGTPILYAYRVADPAAFARAAFAMTLRDAGIRVENTGAATLPDAASYTASNIVATHQSPPLAQDVYVTLKVSDNLHADLMPHLWSIYALHDRSGSLRAAFSAEQTFLRAAGLDTSQAVVADGLGGDAYFTPSFMVGYLKYASAQPWFGAFQRALPILGIDGTLFNIATDTAAKGHVFAKTGTWSSGDLLNDRTLVSAKGLAGYTTTRAGHRVIFALYLNRMTGPADEDTGHAAGQVLGAMADTIYEQF